MKKRVYLFLCLSVLSILFLTGCGTSIEGDWHCIKYSEDGVEVTDEQVKNNRGYGLEKLYTAHFDSNGTGELKAKNGAKSFGFNWKKSDDEYTIDFDEEEIAKTSTKIDGKKLTIVVKAEGHKAIIEMEKD